MFFVLSFLKKFFYYIYHFIYSFFGLTLYLFFFFLLSISRAEGILRTQKLFIRHVLNK